ncbi:hypothetical protein EBQ34_01135 [Vandammella animalimorsus]|uniref:Uncharacterized protein n=1 Tax=Vandammella animalimorsus TaxID=2029117 RepID=A0A3M6RVA8_9BURK|nr:hypothetical protein [Vandammella animalimorsus]RMX18988.1 hypothetical protein EBQ34_01135 [Vandammella animalimorsus]
MSNTTLHPSWYTGVALAALAHRAPPSGLFDEAQLVQWAQADAVEFGAGLAHQALRAMQRRGYALPQSARRSNGKIFNQRWRLTPAGREAGLAAHAALHHGAPDPHALATRLWGLLRIRRRLTTDEAASTLVDAGDGAAYTRQKKAIGALLRAWAKHAPDVVTVAAKREGAHLRYVLLRDLGAWPPPSRAGQVHPTAFASLPPVPKQFVKPAQPAGLEGQP